MEITAKPAVTLDMSGLSCPAPLLGAKRIIDDMTPGQSMLLISDCPGTPDDLLAWARQTGNEVVSTERIEGNRMGYTIRRGGGAQPPVPNAVLDVRGLTCPGPILEAKKLLDGMNAGDILLLISNCPGTPADVDSWVKATSVELVGRVEGARGVHDFYLRRK
ncbi:MAG: sulfurtransferase TusA family protein [Betaproteobacteria bacterium]|nr:sulfurtransferase TusA family protein [Betaproteobacteria bacterium]